MAQRTRRNSNMEQKLLIRDEIKLYREDAENQSGSMNTDLDTLLKAKDNQESPMKFRTCRIKEISDMETEDISELLESNDGEVHKKIESLKAKYTLTTTVIEEEAIESGSSTVVNSNRNLDTTGEFETFNIDNNPRNFFSSFETKKIDSSSVLVKKRRGFKKQELEAHFDKENIPDCTLQKKIKHVRKTFKRVLREKTNLEHDFQHKLNSNYFDESGSDSNFCKTFDLGSHQRQADSGQNTLRRLNLRKTNEEDSDECKNENLYEMDFCSNIRTIQKTNNIKDLDSLKKLDNGENNAFWREKDDKLRRAKKSFTSQKFNNSSKHLRRMRKGGRFRRKNHSFSQKKVTPNISFETRKKSTTTIMQNTRKTSKTQKYPKQPAKMPKNAYKNRASSFLMKLKRKLSKTSEEYLRKNKLKGINSEKTLKFSKYLEMNKQKNIASFKKRRNSSFVQKESPKGEKIRVMEETIKNQNLFIKSLLAKIEKMENFEDVLVENEKLKTENRGLKIDMLKLRSSDFLGKCRRCGE